LDFTPRLVTAVPLTGDHINWLKGTKLTTDSSDFKQQLVRLPKSSNASAILRQMGLEAEGGSHTESR